MKKIISILLLILILCNPIFAIGTAKKTQDNETEDNKLLLKTIIAITIIAFFFLTLFFPAGLPIVIPTTILLLIIEILFIGFGIADIIVSYI